MGERESERADAVRFLCGEASRIEAEARAADAACAKVNVASVITPKMREASAALVNAANAIKRGDHVTPVERTPKVAATYTRAQFAAAVDEAHRCLHEAANLYDQDLVRSLVRRAHEALHTVGAGQERIACGTMDPEAQAMYADLRALRDREIPCGHTVADLIGGTERGPDGKERPSITKCGACLAIRQPEIVAARKAKGAHTPETVLRAMLASYEAAAIAARLQRNVASALAIGDERNGNFRGANDAVRKADAAVRKADAATNHLRNVLAWHLCGYSIAGFVAGSFGGDYEARLRGERPLDAPPLEVP